jgi:hypothetical protein
MNALCFTALGRHIQDAASGISWYERVRPATPAVEVRVTALIGTAHRASGQDGGTR